MQNFNLARLASQGDKKANKELKNRLTRIINHIKKETAVINAARTLHSMRARK